MIDPQGAGPGTEGTPVEPAETTGRYVVTMREGGADAALAALRGVASGDLVRPEDFDDGVVDMAQVDDAGGLLLADLGFAVVDTDPSGAASLLSADDGAGQVLAVEPEYVHHVLETGYLEGYRHAVEDLVERLGGTHSSKAAANGADALFADTADWTWGLEATKTISSPASGVAVRVAVLDTGFALGHPDFAGRPVLSRSFVPGEDVEDGHGHGTHCVGTSCGPRKPAGVRRYGVAYDAEILVGKVLSNAGSGRDAEILAGIAWAVAQNAAVISMSLGAPVKQVSTAYTQIGHRALDRGSLIIAAAGNNARRHEGDHGFVGIPANAPTIIAVGAVDSALAIARFSARSHTVRGGQVDLAGPGVAVFSSWKGPEHHVSISGTSMATPHAAGIAALWAQQTGRRGRELWATLAAESTRLDLPSLDVGGGLVTAPQ
jgi:subtilisin family serine protease